MTWLVLVWVTTRAQEIKSADLANFDRCQQVIMSQSDDLVYRVCMPNCHDGRWDGDQCVEGDYLHEQPLNYARLAATELAEEWSTR